MRDSTLNRIDLWWQRWRAQRLVRQLRAKLVVIDRQLGTFDHANTQVADLRGLWEQQLQRRVLQLHLDKLLTQLKVKDPS